MSGIAETKAAARALAFRVRAAAGVAAPEAAARAVASVLTAVGASPSGRMVAGYLPIRGELDPVPAMAALAGAGFGVCVPEVVRPARPLVFRRWAPGVATEAGAFGVSVPVGAATVVPDVLLVPMLAFDGRGHRLGYGGGFYDRTIAALRGRGLLALGFAYAAQEVAMVPDAETDMVLDAIVTEAGVRVPGGGSAPVGH